MKTKNSFILHFKACLSPSDFLFLLEYNDYNVIMFIIKNFKINIFLCFKIFNKFNLIFFSLFKKKIIML